MSAAVAEVERAHVRKLATGGTVVRKAGLPPVVSPIDPNTPGLFTSQKWGNGGYRGVGGHPGVDWACRRGTPIRALTDGIVRAAGYATGFGPCTIAIYHPAYGISTTYGHGYELFVTYGQRVFAGQRIGSVDSMGDSTGDHLHWELRPGDQAFGPNPPNVDPEQWLALHKSNVVIPPVDAAGIAKIKRMQYLLGVKPQSGRWLAVTDQAYQTLRWNNLTDARGNYALTGKPAKKSSTVYWIQHDILQFTGAALDGIYGPKTDDAWQFCRLLWLNK